jgi:hypothetical protein
MRYKSLNYEVRSGILIDANQWVNTSWFTVEDAPQVIELKWRAASDPDSSDGRLGTWINDAPSETRDGIPNPNSRVDLVRWGLVAGVDTGTLGSMELDAFESRRSSHIGLPGEEPTPMPSGTPTATTTP